jgi:hypothetical protein
MYKIREIKYISNTVPIQVYRIEIKLHILICFMALITSGYNELETRISIKKSFKSVKNNRWKNFKQNYKQRNTVKTSIKPYNY